ncbi:MAG: PAS domain S-box protein [Rhodocyclaceae bacterium]|nr:MAG: PAS domain S-box protein [Rhodocyclaceae bacterium]
MNKANHYQDVFDHANDGIFIHDEVSGLILDANRMASEMTGYSKEELFALTVGGISCQDRGYDFNHATQQIHRAVKTGPQIFEWWIKTKEGKEFPAEVNLKRILLGDSHRILALVRDISDRKAAELRIKGRELYYRKLISNSADGIAILDPHGLVRWIGPSIRHILGYRERDIRDRSIFDAILAEDVPAMKEALASLTESDQGTLATQYRIRHRNGAIRIHEASCKNLLKDESVGGLLINFRDITARVEAEEKAKLRDHELSHVARLSTMGEMSSALAHELNQPFFAIVNYIGGTIRRVKAGNVSTSGLLEVLKETQKEAERAGRIIRTVRDFTRKSLFHREMADLRSIVQDISTFIEIQCKPSAVRFEILPGATPVPVNCDRVLIEQVIANLACNGIEAMTDTPQEKRLLRILVQTSSGGKACVAIEDRGHGLPRSNPEKIFDAFFTTKKEGLGIGLSLCRSIIDSHDGHLWATTRADGGAVFHFSLPLAQESDHA